MLSYSSLKNSGKVTLPSVEMWGTNMNILRDPPKSLYTRRIDKVSDTQQVTLQEAETNDRRLENINIYARGVNPMTGVSYNNYNKGGGGANVSPQQQASLPYKVENVRPPLLSQYDLQPLSRLPRDWFYTFSNPEFPQLLDNLRCVDTSKCVRSNVETTEVLTNKLRNIYAPPVKDVEKHLRRTPLTISRDVNKTSLLSPVDPERDHSILKAVTDAQKIAGTLPSSSNLGSASLDYTSVHENGASSAGLDAKMQNKSTKNRAVPFKANPSKKISSGVQPKTVFHDCRKIRVGDIQVPKSIRKHDTASPLQTVPINNRQLQGSVESTKDIRYFSSGQILDQNLPILESKLPAYNVCANVSALNGNSGNPETVHLPELDAKTSAREVETPRLFYFEPRETHMTTKKKLSAAGLVGSSGSFDPRPSSIPVEHFQNQIMKPTKGMERKTNLSHQLNRGGLLGSSV